MDILVADIGGTNSRFAHFRENEKNELELAGTQWLKTRDSASFGDLLGRLRAEGFSLKPEEADISSIAVAGPVRGGLYSSPPFISWDIDISNCKRDFGIKRCVLLNDFVAQAYACLSPVGKSAEQVLSGTSAQGTAMAVIGAGTGLGKAALLPDRKGGYVPMPSEGGHASFPFFPGEETEYQEFLLRESGNEYMTGNDVVSGRGLSSLHRFLTGEVLKPDEVVSAFTPDSETLLWTARFYGRMCRNYALETLALGGLYIAGGVAARAPEIVRHPAFGDEFRSSPKLKEVLRDIPVFLIADEQSGLWGAAQAGMLELESIK
jgi:glucokinase